MNSIIQLKTATPPLLMTVALFCIGLLPQAHAVSPAPDGGYPAGNTAEGQSALLSLTTGGFNTAVGFLSLSSSTTASFNTATGAGTLLANTADQNTATGAGALLSNTIGGGNTANGAFALFFNTTGTSNTATGLQAFQSNTTGFANTANGASALFSNTTGSFNTATGGSALQGNITGSFNTANGFAALLSNTTGNFNTATGNNALRGNTTGSGNTANGNNGLTSNTTGDDNTATGVNALSANSTGTSNTATGVSALLSNTIGTFNTAIGRGALQHNTTGQGNTAIGSTALFNNATGSNNIGLGEDAGHALTTGDNNIDIDNLGVAGESGTIRIGTAGAQSRTFIAGISGVNEGSPAAVFINTTTGQLGTTPPSSSRRFKKEIKPMDKNSEAILTLKPVTFHYKSDKTNRPEFGLIAEEVAAVNPDLVVRDENGEIYTVRYDAVNAMLLNEFLKEHRKVQELEAKVAQERKDLQAAMTKLEQSVTAQLKEHAARLENVSARVQMSKAAPEVACLPAVALRERGPATP
jgi:hypothetical protein